MTFNPNIQLDPGQITDRRGMGGAGGIAVGGGGIGLLLLLVYVLLGGDPGALGGGNVTDPGAVTGPGSSALATDCKTGRTRTSVMTAGSSATSTASRRTGRASS